MNDASIALPETVEQFNAVSREIQSRSFFREPLLFGIGREVRTPNGTLASVRYPAVNGPGQNINTATILQFILREALTPHQRVQTVRLSREDIRKILSFFRPFAGDGKRHRNLDTLRAALAVMDSHEHVIVTFIFDDVAPISVEDATLKLYGLSLRHFKPNTLNLEKIFTKLPNVAWIGDTPFDAESVDDLLLEAAFENKPFAPHMVDKFPLYTHRINAIKMGVRITDQHKVRLGAYLGEGTTLMPGASYVNFNAGTDGGMIEGRISSSAFVGKGSDVGGGASILGTLSGGNDIPISIGRNCLLEANSVTGIPLGDACIVAAATQVLASSRVMILLNGHPLYGKTVKASSLAGINGVTFRRNDEYGRMEIVRTARNIEFAKKLDDGESILNADLHAHN